MKAHVYVISGKYQKIGFSQNPRSRLDQFKTASPYTLDLAFNVECADAPAVERRAHELLAGQRLSGEWFDVSVEHAIETVKQALEDVESDRKRTRLRVAPTMKGRAW